MGPETLRVETAAARKYGSTRRPPPVPPPLPLLCRGVMRGVADEARSLSSDTSPQQAQQPQPQQPQVYSSKPPIRHP